VPVLTPFLSSLWLGLVTPLYARIGRKLIESIVHPTVVRDKSALDTFDIHPVGVDEAVRKALEREDKQFAATRWSDALSSSGNTHVIGAVQFGEVWDVTYKQPGRRGILQAFPISLHSRQITARSEAARVNMALEQVEMIYPEVRKYFDGGFSKCWDEDEWARGGTAFYKPGQFTSLLPHVARPEGRIHFPGEHTSVWIDGWMQGALESGNRVAQEINAAV
jgi:monoamine oxidase